MRVRLRWVVRGLLLLVVLALAGTKLVHRTHSSGYPLKVVTTECSPDVSEATERDVVLYVRSRGQFSINSESVPDFTALATRLRLIYATRDDSGKVLFVDVDDGLPVQTAADAMSIALRAVPSIRFVVITPETRKPCQEKWASIPGAA